MLGTSGPGLNRNGSHCNDNVTSMTGIVKKGERFMGKIHRIVTGWFRPNAGKKAKRPVYKTAVECISCGYRWKTARISDPCPNCTSAQVVALALWAPAMYGMPAFKPNKGV